MKTEDKIIYCIVVYNVFPHFIDSKYLIKHMVTLLKSNCCPW